MILKNQFIRWRSAGAFYGLRPYVSAQRLCEKRHKELFVSAYAQRAFGRKSDLLSASALPNQRSESYRVLRALCGSLSGVSHSQFGIRHSKFSPSSSFNVRHSSLPSPFNLFMNVQLTFMGGRDLPSTQHSALTRQISMLFLNPQLFSSPLKPCARSARTLTRTD